MGSLIRTGSERPLALEPGVKNGDAPLLSLLESIGSDLLRDGMVVETRESGVGTEIGFFRK
jgi:hypothetical protein